MAPARTLYLLRPTMGHGGADRVTLTLLEQLDRSRFRPTLVLMRAEGDLLSAVPSDVPVETLGAGSLWTAWWPLARLLRRRPPEILLSTSSGANVVAALASRLTRARHRLVLSERSTLTRRGPLRGVLMPLLKRWLYPVADGVIAVSDGVKRDLLGRLGLPEPLVQVVYSPLVTPELSSLAAAAPDHPWFAEPTPVVLAAGRLVRAKGFDLLLKAFAQLRRRRPARLMILGEGPLRDRLERQVRQLDLAADVALPGFEPNPFRYMARCAVFVLSSRREGLPGVLIQAMACGAAVVATDCPVGPAEIIEPGVTGRLVPVGDPARLARAMERLLDHPDERDRMARQAAREAARRFGSAAAVAAYEAALLGQPAAATRARS